MTSAVTFTVDDDNTSNGVADVTAADREDFLRDKNVAFFASVAPTLVYIFLLMLAGVVGNSVVFLVYYRRFKPSVSRTFILAMSVFDLLTNALSLPADVLELRYHNTFSAVWACKAARTVKSFLSFTSAAVLVAVAVDRYRKICRPHATPTTNRQVRYILTACVLLSAALTLPYSVMTGAQTVSFPGSNVTGRKCSLADSHVRTPYLLAYNVTTGLIFVTCVALMITSYVGIARQLWRHKQRAGVSVTGRAVSRAGGGGGGGRGGGEEGGLGSSRLNLHEMHTYTDEETSCADRGDTGTSGRSGHHASSLDIATRSGHHASSLDIATRSGHHHHASNLDTVRAGPISYIKVENSSQAREGSGEEDQLGVGSLDASDDMAAVTTQTASTSTPRSADSLPAAATTTVGSHKENECFIIKITPPPAAVSSRGEAPDEGGEAQPEQDLLSKTQATKLHKFSNLLTADTKKNISSLTEKTFSRGSKKPIRKSRGSVRKIPTRTTWMMFVLTAIFIVNFLPYLVVVTLRARLSVPLLVDALGLNGYHVLVRSYVINSAVNAFVYSFCSAKFRLECRRLFNCR